MRNHFATESVAARYAQGRPEFHANLIEILRPRLERRQYATALDVGCGTGASTRPLNHLTRRAVGLDSSLAMLSHAYRSPHASYVGGWAEELPFRTDSFDLLTVSLAFHWLDRKRFLSEALRVLDRTGLLVVYGFQCESRNEYENSVEFSRERLVDYLVTQTNVIAAVEEGEEDIDEVRGWLLRELASFFEGGESRRFVFECPIWILRPKGGGR